MWPNLVAIFLPPANIVCEGYVFTCLCHSVHGGGLVSPLEADTPPGADTPQEQVHTPPRPGDTGNKRPVRILLECILVYDLILQGRWGGGYGPLGPPDPLLHAIYLSQVSVSESERNISVSI